MTWESEPAVLEGPAVRLSETELREWIRAHRVCWETSVSRLRTGDGLRPVGYEVLVSASCVGPGPWDPGSQRAIEMVGRIRQLVEEATPPDRRADLHVAAFEPVFQYRTQADWQPEARVIVEIRHGEGFSDGIDDDERLSRQWFEAGLERLGAARGAWPVPLKTRP